MIKRRWLLWVLVAAFAWLLITRFNELEALVDILSQGIWLWMALAALFQVAYYLLLARVYQVTFALVGVGNPLHNIVPLLLGTLFINAVAPSGGTAGLALFVDDAIQRGESGPRTTAGLLLAVIATYLGFGVLLIASMLFLFRQELLEVYQVLTAFSLLAFMLLLTALLALGWRWSNRLQWVLGGLQRIVNGIAGRLRRPPLLVDEWAAEMAGEFTQAAQAIGHRPGALISIVGWAIGAHLANAASLFATFLAFRRLLHPGIVLAGFAIGYLFVIMAPSPQGIGFVETIVPLVFAGFGVPEIESTVVVLAYRGLAFWLPLLIGFFLLRRLKTLGAEERAVTDVWSVRVVALLTALMGVVNIISAVDPALARTLEPVTQYALLQLRRGGQLGAALSGFALFLVANALWRRKRAGWYLALVVLLLSTVSLLLHGGGLTLRSLLTVALAVWLFLLRPHFHARSDLPSVRQGMQVLGVALAFTLTYGTLGLFAVGRLQGHSLTLVEAASGAVSLLLSLRAPDWLLALEPGRFFFYSLYIISGVTLLYGLLLLIRPVLLRRRATAAERERVKQLVARYGSRSLARLALQPDKAYFFTPGGSVVAFEARGRAAVALGDPIGPPEDLAEAITAFRHYCAGNDWTPAFFQIGEKTLPYYQKAGYESLPIGREAVVDLDAQALGEALPGPLRPLLDDGHQVRLWRPPQTAALVEELHAISDAWLTMRHTRESGFALSWFDDVYVRQTPVAVSYAPSGLASAFAVLVVNRRRQAVAVDLLRHRPQIAEGTLELLLVTILQWASKEGFTEASLGVNISGGSDLATEQMLRYIHKSDDNSLDHFDRLRARFKPSWRPRFLVYTSASSLPAVWAAVLQVSADVGWPWDLLKRPFRLYNRD